MIEGAINGMLKSLDPYSGYLSEEDLQDLQASSDGVYDGLGVEVVADNAQIKVVNTLENSPAERADIKAMTIRTGRVKVFHFFCVLSIISE